MWYNVKDLADAKDLINDLECHRRQEMQAKATVGSLGQPKRKWQRRAGALPTTLSLVSVVKAASRHRSGGA
jgi:hypothetical protein